MNASEHKASISWLLGIVVTLGMVVATWDRVGWITIPAYAQDHEGASVKQQQTAILKSLEGLNSNLVLLQEGQDRNQDQWECDETGEELKELRHALAGDLSVLDRVDTNIEKERLDEVWTTLRCTRFID